MSIENNTSSESLHTVIERQYRDFEQDTFQSLVKAVSTLDDNSFLDAYPYIDLSTEEVGDWCIALDSLLGYLLKHPVELDSDKDRVLIHYGLIYNNYSLVHLMFLLNNVYDFLLPPEYRMIVWQRICLMAKDYPMRMNYYWHRYTRDAGISTESCTICI